jgi:hypothetical protein
MNKTTLFFFIAFLSLWACATDKDEDTVSLEEIQEEVKVEALFQKLSANDTRIRFENVLKETPAFNYYNYTYLYNGSGVAVADFNNDGLLDLFFVGAMSSNKLYINMGNLRFKDITAVAGVAGPNVLKTGVAVHDVNEDGYMDIYVCHSGISPKEMRTNALYINNQDGTFTEEAVSRGLDDQSNTNHALFFDYDNDNDLDLFLLNHPTDFKLINNMSLKQLDDGTILRDGRPEFPAEADRLFENIGNGQFREVSEQAGIFQKAYGLSVTPLDINGDGFMDLYVGNDFIEPDFLYINQGDGTFIDSIDAYFPHMSNNTMGADAGDVNNDGRLDFMSLDMLPETHYRQKTLMTSMRYDRYKQLEKYNYGRQLMRNTLFIQGTDQKMRDIGCYAGVDATDWSWSPLIADFDGDGWKDIFISNGYRRDLTDLDFMMYYDENVGRTSLPEDNVEEVLAQVPIQPVPNYMYQNQGDYTFTSRAADWGLGEPVFSNGALTADLDSDGDLDLVVNNFDMPTFIYENRARQLHDHKYLSIDLKGPAGNSEGIGADIRLYRGERVQLQNVQRCKGFMSYSAATAHFGLDSDLRIDSIVIRWPDGRVQRLFDVDANQTLTVDYANGSRGAWKRLPSAQAYLQPKMELDFTHTENDFIDLKREPLLPRALSRKGPVVEVLDFDQDGREDVFIGGARGQAPALFLQTADGAFTSVFEDFFTGEAMYEDVAVGILDITGNGFPDLYIGSGGYSESVSSLAYRDRLYINKEGKGIERGTLPMRSSPTGAVATGDFNGDGLTDVFVGGGAIPNQYPEAAGSYMSWNEGRKLVAAPESIWSTAPPDGIINSALAADFTGDGQTDLVLAGEWMPITLYSQTESGFDAPVQVKDSEGWWNHLHSCQFEADGPSQILAGNFGQNTRWRARPDQPIEVFAADFDRSGRHTPILTHYMDGEQVPVPRRDALMELMPSLRSDFVKFSTYAEARIDDLVSLKSREHIHRKAHELRSGYLSWSAQGPGTFKAFPPQIQWAGVHAFATTDLTGNGRTDIILGGNNFELEIESARTDALSLAVLIQTAENEWQFVPQEGLINRFNRELRSLDLIQIGGETLVVAGWKEHPIEILKITMPAAPK